MGSSDQIIGILGGAIAGIVLGDAYRFARERVRLAKTFRYQRERHARDQGGRISRGLLTRFIDSQALDQLYFTRNFPTNQPIPILSKEEWCFLEEVSATGDHGISRGGSGVQEFSVDSKAIRQMLDAGVHLWDGPITYLITGSVSNGSPELSVGDTKYFGYATLVEQLVAEISGGEGRRLRVIRRHSKKSLLQTYFSNAAAALKCPAKPLALACSVPVVLPANGSPRILVQERSREVMSLAGMHAVVPTYGLEIQHSGSKQSRKGILYYNFVREFLEEVLGFENVIRMDEATQIDPDFIFNQMAPAQAIDRDMETGTLRLWWTGLGINPRDAICHLTMLATYDVEIDDLASRMVRNFETKKFKFPELYGQEVDEWMANGQLTPASIQAIDRARSVYGDLH